MQLDELVLIQAGTDVPARGLGRARSRNFRRGLWLAPRATARPRAFTPTPNAVPVDIVRPEVDHQRTPAPPTAGSPGTADYTYFADSLLQGAAGAGRDALVQVSIAGVLLLALSFLPTLVRRVRKQ